MTNAFELGHSSKVNLMKLCIGIGITLIRTTISLILEENLLKRGYTTMIGKNER